MTTKFEHSIVNPLTRNNNFAVITPHSYPKPQGCFSSMDMILEPQKIDSMRKKMLMQEQLFKHQVQELHRLYNQQRKVMQEIKNGLKQRKETRDITTSEFTIRHHHHKTETEPKQSFKPFSERIERANQSSSAEMAPAPIKNFQESTHPFEDHHGLKKTDDEVEVELTLSIGLCTRKRRSKSAEIQDSDEVQEVASSSSSVYQVTTRPHWLLQDLSLNRT